MINIPYYEQKTDYTCGPACLKMVFEHLGQKTTKRELAAFMNTTSEAGTHTDEMPRAARAHGLSAFTKKGASVEDIKDFIRRGIPVIVDYVEPEAEDRHFAVAIGFDDETLVLNDPWHGEGFRLQIGEFERRWADLRNRYQKWFMAVYGEERSA